MSTDAQVVETAMNTLRGVIEQFQEEIVELKRENEDLEEKNDKLSAEVDEAESRATRAENALEERDWSKMAARFHDYARGRGWITDPVHDVPYHVTPTVYQTALESALDEAV